MWLQQIVQPGGPGSCFKGDLQLSVKPMDKVQNHVRFGLDHAFHHDLSGSIPDRNRNAFLVHIHADIFSAGHKGRCSSGAVELALKTYSKRDALLYCVALPDILICLAPMVFCALCCTETSRWPSEPRKCD